VAGSTEIVSFVLSLQGFLLLFLVAATLLTIRLLEGASQNRHDNARYGTEV